MIVVALAGMILLLLPGVADRLGRRLRPAEWARLCATALTGGTILLEAVLVLRATPGVLRAIGLHSFAHACDRVLGPLVVGGTPATFLAAATGIALPTAAGFAAMRECRLRRRLADDLWLGRRHIIDGYRVVELPLQRPLAVSFDDGQPTIVISSGLLELLSTDEITAVVRHEAAHLRHHHQRLHAAARLIAPLRGLPGIRQSSAALNLSVERWADEDACTGSPAIREALRTSLLRLAQLPGGLAGATQFAEAHTVAARVDALAATRRPVNAQVHALLYLPGTAALLVAAPAIYQWANQTRSLLTMAGRCPV